jgi:exodeoxyribonuclease-5
MDITLTESQKNAIQQVRDWLKNPNGEQIFRLYGYAGTGKTTIIKFLVEDLGLILGEDVIFATLTGKAAQVMSRLNNIPCSTIHGAAHLYVSPDADVMTELETKIKTLREYDEDVRELQDQLDKLRKPKFQVNPNSILFKAKLIVLDECSMIGDDVANDLLSFKKRILLIGDPGQLPPVDGRLCGGFGDEIPNVFLEEIHRQALESPIIALATKARKGELIKDGVYGTGVMKAPVDMITPKDLISFDQVIVGTHKTRRSLNNQMREAKGFTNELPTSPDEKIIVMRNYKYAGLMNGQFITLNNVTKRDEYRLYADVTNEDGVLIGNRSIYSGYFLDHSDYQEHRIKEDYNIRTKAMECDFAEAITCHKAQGSQWRNVAVVDDGWGFKDTESRNRWLYTAITRASDGLMIFYKRWR